MIERLKNDNRALEEIKEESKEENKEENSFNFFESEREVGFIINNPLRNRRP